MSDMLQLVVRMERLYVRRDGYCHYLSVHDLYDKLKHVGH